MEIIYKKVQDLIPYINNSRTHSEEQLMKSMITCQKNEEYSVSFEFCSKAETGKRILELLTRQ